jgi:hypothetical protein
VTGRGEPVGWRGPRELFRVLSRPHNMRRTIPLALIVGSLSAKPESAGSLRVRQGHFAE